MRYYYVDSSNKPAGPYTAEQLAAFYAQGVITASTLVAPEGGTQWKPYPEIIGSLTVPAMPITAPSAGNLYAPPQAQGFPNQQYPAGYVPNYMAPAILTTIFCCPPFGIVSIVKASEVNSKLAFGDLAGAQLSSAAARKWAWVAFWVALGCLAAYFLFIFFVIGAVGYGLR